MEGWITGWGDFPVSQIFLWCYCPSFRACWGGYILLFHQLDVGKQGQLHQELGWLPVRHNLQDGECLLHAQRQRYGALSQIGKGSAPEVETLCPVLMNAVAYLLYCKAQEKMANGAKYRRLECCRVNLINSWIFTTTKILLSIWCIDCPISVVRVLYQ